MRPFLFVVGEEIVNHKLKMEQEEVKKYIMSLGFKVLINIWPDIVYYRP